MRPPSLLRTFAAVLAVFAVASLAGCGDDPSSGTPTSAPDGGGMSTGSAVGTVSLVQGASGNGYAVYASASFPTTPSASTPVCPVTSLNAQCEYLACPTLNAPSASDGDGGAPAFAQAGTIAIRGPSLPAGGLSLASPSAGEPYATVTPAATAPYFHSGDLITFSASGDPASVGPFTLSLPAPADAVVTSPSFGSAPLSLTRGADVTVTWQPGTAGTSMAVTLYQLDQNGDGGASKLVSCVFDATVGSGTLPSSGGFANFDVIDGSALQGLLIVSPYSSGSASAVAADGARWSIYGTVGASPMQNLFTLP